jgi:autotransporter-associated beta strand protein
MPRFAIDSQSKSARFDGVARRPPSANASRHGPFIRNKEYVMARVKIVSTLIALGTATLLLPAIAQAQLDDRLWVGGTGSQQWQLDTNWNPAPFPNDPGRVDPDPAVITPVVGANLSVNLAANLNVDVGATDVTVAALTLGSTSNPVTTNVTSSGAGRLVFENFESNNTVPEPDVCSFNCGSALITSQGVAGATNTISAVVGLNDGVHVAGTNDITFSGGITEIGSSGTLSALPVGRTAFITGNITTNDTSVTGGEDDTPLALNSDKSSQGTIDVTGVISGSGRMRYGTQDSAPILPLGTVIVHSANNYSGRTILGRGNLILAHNSALGTGDVKQEGPAAGSLETGYNFFSDDDARAVANNMIIGQWQTIKGTHSLEWSGRAIQTNARGWINMLPADKTFKLSGQQFTFEVEDGDVERILTFDGSGKTLIAGGIRNRWDSEAGAEAINAQIGSIRVRGTGVIVVDGDNALTDSDSNFNGTVYVQGTNLHFATNADIGTAAQFASQAGAVGVDSGVVNNSTFFGLLNNSTSPTADEAGLPVLFDRGGLMLGNGEYGMNLDFTAAQANAANMSLAATESGNIYTGTITPADNTYRFGGGKGTLTLPNANQMTGARSVVATNGGEVNVTGTNNYTGTTSLIAKYVSTLQNAAANDTISFSDGDIIPNDQIYLGTTLTATNLANGGVPSSIGSSSNAASNLYIQGSTLKYVGSGASTDRLFTIGSGGATIDSSGAGALSFTNTAALAVDVAEGRTGNVNAFATGNNAADRATIRNIASTEDLQPGMPVASPGLPTTGDGAGIPADTVITRILGPNDIMVSNSIGNFAFYNDTPLTFGAAPERKLTLTGANVGNNTLGSLVQNASDGGPVGVTKSGGGKWILTNNNTYTGTTNVNAGTLLINGSQTGAGLTTVASGATLGGAGSLGGALTNNGTINPGASVGTLTVNGDTTMAANSHLAIELAGAAADKLAITGNLDLSALGNFLDVLGAGTGSSWVIATYTGTLTGVFETITSGYSVNYGTGTNSQITLNAAGPAGLPGDFNNDGKVDNGDYVTWRKNNGTNNTLVNDGGLGTPIRADHYNLWRSNFGKPPGAGSALNGGAVPEPSSCALICLALVGAMGGVRRRG